MAAIDLESATIVELRQRMEEGRLAARALLEHCLERIDRHDGATRAVIELWPGAPALADELDGECRRGYRRGPLHGIPLLLKDNIETAEGMVTSAGSLALAQHRARRDAALVERLRAAGAVIFGKTNLSEWANFRARRSVSGWSSRGGQTRNPYALSRSPGGSSSGSAVAVAAGYAVAAVGTETDGSIVSPSSMNAIVGLKPTLGRVSRRGIVPISRNQDTAGPMARCVADAAVLLAAMAGPDERDPPTLEGAAHPPGDLLAGLDGGALRGARLGIVRMLADYHEGVAAILDSAVGTLRDAGAEIVDDVRVVPVEEVRRAEYEVLVTDFRADLDRYLAGLDGSAEVHSLEELVAFNRARAAEVMPWFGQDLLERALEAARGDAEAYRRARQRCLTATRGSIDGPLRERGLDALVTATTSAPWPVDWVNGDHRLGSSAWLAAISGYPSISVPAGYLHGLPVGISFVGTAWSEPRLLQLAHAFEQHRHARVPPGFAPALPFECP